MLVTLVTALLTVSPVGQDAPIVRPGAPGAASRTITAREAFESSQTSFIPADVQFMQHMIVHHRQAVEMVDLLQTRAQDQRVRLLGQRIAISQTNEMMLMRGWLLARNQPETAPDMHAMHGGSSSDAHAGRDAHAGHAMSPDDVAPMPGMLTPRQMRALEAASGPEFDRLFLQGMIQHHQGAIDMVTDLLAVPDAAQDHMLSDFATSVNADQSSEILRMRNLLSELCTTC